jgi:hypothetical protein
MDQQKLSTHLASWRKAEDKFYGAALSAPEIYTAGVQLVRGIVNSLRDVESVEALLEAYTDSTIQQVVDVAEALNITHRDFLDYNLARDAAFYLRHQEILEAQAKAGVEARLEEARRRGAEWVTLYHVEQEGRGVTFFQRLEMVLSTGVGIYSAIELDWEKGRMYVVEPMLLDPATGEPRRKLPPPDPRQEFTSLADMDEALAALRKKYSAGQDAV